MKKMLKNKKGFTLIELLIVIVIIGILAVAFLPTILGAPAKGRDTQRLADLQRIQKMMLAADLEGTKAIPADYTPASGTAEEVLNPDGGISIVNLFGGVIPTPPSDPGLFAAGGEWSGANYYVVVSPSADYKFGIYTRVELEENANVSCKNIAVAGTITPFSYTSGDDPCYVIYGN